MHSTYDDDEEKDDGGEEGTFMSISVDKKEREVVVKCDLLQLQTQPLQQQ